MSWRTCCRRRAPSASSSTTTRCTRSSTCRSKRRSSARPNSLAANRSSPSRGIATSSRRVAFSRKTSIALLQQHLGPRGSRMCAGVGSRLELWRAVVLHGIPAATGRELSWILDETDGAVAVPDRSSRRTRGPRSPLSPSWTIASGEERRSVRRLWNACLEAVGARRRARGSRDACRSTRFAIATGSAPSRASTPTPGFIRR